MSAKAAGENLLSTSYAPYMLFYHLIMANMEHPTRAEALSAGINDLTISIKLLLDNRHTVPALMVLYGSIDFFGSVLRPETEVDTVGKTRQYFKKWVEHYMVGQSHLAFTPEELWGARCGLLHARTASSKISRDAKGRELHYTRGNLPQEMQQKLKIVSSKGKKLFIDVDLLYEAFKKGIERFLANIQNDRNLEKRALHHASKILGVWRYV
jgi:hypothetical protein